MTEASKTAEPSSQPTKRGRKAWLIGLAVVVAAVTIALLANAPKPEPVKVWFVRATNEAGVKRLVFEGTNGTGRKVVIFAAVFTGAVPDAKAPTVPSLPYNFTNSAVPTRTSFCLTMVPPPNDATYYVEWVVLHEPADQTRWRRFRWACFDYASAHNMPRLAGLLLPNTETHMIPSTEIKE